MAIVLDFSRDNIIAIVRGVPLQRADEVALALQNGDVRLIEVTLNTDGALRTIERWRERFADTMQIGAGTVLTLKQAKDALMAGARYLISPHTDEALIDFGREAGVPVFPGAFTPSEIVRAHVAGASAVKLFPAGAAGGPRYLKDILAPLTDIPLVAVGGVGVDNARAYLAAGAVAVGVGGALIDPVLVREGRYGELTERARALVAAARSRTTELAP